MGIVLPLSAATYYVDPDFGNDANTGTTTNAAWLHLPDAVGTPGSGWMIITNGDTVLFKGGSTNGQIKLTPTWYQGHPAFDSILIQSGHLATPPWGSGRAIIDGFSNKTWGVWFSGIVTNSAILKGVTFDGFEVREILAGAAGPGFDTSNGSSCILVGGNYVTQFLKVMRCWLHNAYPGTGDDKGHGMEFGGPNADWIVTQNHIGPYIGTKGVEPTGASFGVISNNFFSGCADHCIALSHSTNVDVCFNTIFDMPIPIMKHEPQYGIGLSAADRCDVYNNIIYRSMTVTNFGTEDWPMGIGSYTSDHTNRIMFNTVAFFGDFGSGGNSTALRMGDGNSTLGYTNFGQIIQNNIIVSNFNAIGKIQYIVRTNTVLGEDVQWNCFFGTNATANVMSYNDGTTYFYFPLSTFNPGSGTYSNNVQLAPIFSGGALPDGVTSDYLPNRNFFALSPATPSAIYITPNRPIGDSAHGYNSNSNKFLLDIIGTVRVNWSMGAYEFSTNTTLVVNSVNPSSGVPITVTPNDLNGNGNGTTAFSRAFSTNALVSLIAPATVVVFGITNTFSEWQLNGMDYDTNASTTITILQNQIITAIYLSPAQPVFGLSRRRTFGTAMRR